MIAAPVPLTVAERIDALLGLATVPPEDRTPPPMPWRDWVRRYFHRSTSAPFAPRHEAFWEWVAALRPGTKPRARVEVWPRGGGKSHTVEMSCAWLGSHPEPARHFVLYVSETQAQADRHVQSIAGMLERVGIDRAVNEYGSAKGWKRTEIRAANGFNVVAFGLDSGLRGVKLDEFRPDLIVMDDIDGRHDSPATVEKKIETITQTILPSGSADYAVVVVQNKIHKDSIVARLAEDRADFLHDRHVATVEPAVRDLQYEQVTDDEGRTRYRITAGEPTWAGQDLETCEGQLNDWGIAAFEREAQHEVEKGQNGLWKRERDIAPFRQTIVPDLSRVVVAVDPNAGEGGDEAGIVVAGVSNRVGEMIYPELHGYVLADRTVAGGPRAWAEEAVAAYHAFRADKLVAEVNNGGEMVDITIGTVPGAPEVHMVHASRGKLTRAEPVQVLYEHGRVHHVGTFRELEGEMCSWRPGQPSPNRMDALVWAMTDLLLDGEGDFAELDAYMRRQLGRPT